MATLADVIKKYGSMEAFKAANPTQPTQPTTPTNVFSNTASFAASTAKPAVVQPTITTPASATPPTTVDPAKIPTFDVGNRLSPTVATATNPVISKTTSSDIVYDANNPEDYLKRMQARLATGGKPLTADEYYQSTIAQEAVDKKKKEEAVVDPFATKETDSQAALDAAIKAKKESDNSILGAYTNQVNAGYDIKKEQTIQAGEKRKQAEQNIYSFSGFGRSTAAADAQGAIEKETQSSLGALEAARQADIAAKQAELAGADSDTVKALRSQVAGYQKAAQDFQIESIKKTAEANAKGGASYMEAIKNLMTTAQKNQIDIGDPKVIESYATLGRNADGTVNEEFVKHLPTDVQAIIRSAISTSQPVKGNYKYIAANKYNGAGYFDEDTGKFIPLSVAKAQGIGNGTGGGGGGSIAGSIASAIDTVMNDPNLSKSVGGYSLISSIPGTPQYSFNAKVDNLVNNLVLPNIKYLKGSTSDKDIEFIKSASTRLKTGMSEPEFRQALQELRDKYGSISNSSQSSGTTTTKQTSTQGASATSAPAKGNTPQSSQGVDFALSLMD